MSTPSSGPTQTSSTSKESKEPILALPSADVDAATKIDVSSGQGTVKMDHLGPMVVNTDGTLSRITNWESMAEIERSNTLRIITKRNKERLEALRRARGEGEDEKET